MVGAVVVVVVVVVAVGAVAVGVEASSCVVVSENHGVVSPVPTNDSSVVVARAMPTSVATARAVALLMAEPPQIRTPRARRTRG